MIAGHVESECACAKCVTMCKRPCWPTPAEVRELIRLGHAKKLMADWWEGDPNVVADIDRTWKDAPEMTGDFFTSLFRPPPIYGGCVFHVEGKCALHGVCKPLEGRLAHHSQSHEAGQALHREVAKFWATPDGIALVAEWRALVGAV